MRVGRNAEALRRLVPRPALAFLSVATAIAVACNAGTATAGMGPPDALFTTAIGGTKYLCARWGAPPKVIHVTCVPKKKAATKGAA